MLPHVAVPPDEGIQLHSKEASLYDFVYLVPLGLRVVTAHRFCVSTSTFDFFIHVTNI